jgi:hypothetical protein
MIRNHDRNDGGRVGMPRHRAGTAGAVFALISGLPALGLLSACTVGDGTGEARGSLYVKGCNENGDWGQPELPRQYDLRPTFYAGEPVEDIKQNGTRNRIVIRLQDSGKSREANDVLQFDIVNSYPVALCVRGNSPTEDLSAFCHRPPGQAWPRIRVGPNLPIRVSLALRETCPRATLIGSGRDGTGAVPHAIVALPPSEWRSWIELSEFGSASRQDPPRNFRVDFDERLTARSFHIDLLDDRVIEAERRRDPLPEPELTGSLEGRFDFKLERGQGAQTFP